MALEVQSFADPIGGLADGRLGPIGIPLVRCLHRVFTGRFANDKVSKDAWSLDASAKEGLKNLLFRAVHHCKTAARARPSSPKKPLKPGKGTARGPLMAQGNTSKSGGSLNSAGLCWLKHLAIESRQIQ